MTQVDLLVTNGIVTTDAWKGVADVSVVDGRVLAVSQSNGHSRPTSKRTIDATGCYVMPGGVDPHCHIGVPLGEFTTLDDFASASLAALAGGTTTIVDFAIPRVGEDPRHAFSAKLERAKDSRCDFALHGCIVTDDPPIAEVIQGLVTNGVRTIKLFTTYKGLLMVGIDIVESVMRALKPYQGLTYVHAEANELIESAQETAAREHRVDASNMADTRPAIAEETAVAAVLAAAKRAGAPVYFVHQSTPGAVDMVASARSNGTHAYSESCTHYLTLTSDAYTGNHPERYVCCPPLRDADLVRALGDRVAMGQIHTVGSDHCCYDTGQKVRRRGDVRLMPNGMPGIETRLGVLWDAFVDRGEITPEAFVRMVASDPARLNGLFPKKGTLQPGSDADIVVLDPNAARVLTTSELHMNSDYTPYEGRSVRGWPRAVVSGGRVVVDDGRLLDPGPVGSFQRAEPIQLR